MEKSTTFLPLGALTYLTEYFRTKEEGTQGRGIRGTYLPPWTAVAQPKVRIPAFYLLSGRVAFHHLSHTALHKASSIDYAGRYGSNPTQQAFFFGANLLLSTWLDTASRSISLPPCSYAGARNQNGLWPQPASGQPPELPYFRACRRCHALVASAHITSPLTSPQIKKYRHRKRAKYDFTKAQLYPILFTKAYRHTDTKLHTTNTAAAAQPLQLRHSSRPDRSTEPRVPYA
ncbi:hypothetical protein CSIM01_07063 [Colletotrichum simmondsii]|uniref:Uncharacterized protein n=1 Tax=Colletotrichum simmondsii TaxID=703756 RepID=A0A135RTG0_9PEZI|nr:hypothetical protein CSIM01_07063 [Colletotrichum simmondsii]